MKKVVMDTNFIMEVARNRIDLKREMERIMDFPYELAVTEGTINELKKIAEKQRGKERQTAKLALILIKNTKMIEGKGYVDKLLEKRADSETIIATQDRELKGKIRTGKIVVRQKKYLKLVV